MIKKFRRFSAFVAAITVAGILSLSLVAQAAPNDPNLIFHWNLNEGSGAIANDNSGNGNTGSIYNGASYVVGHEGTAVALNGVDQYIETDTPFAFMGTPDQPYALSSWVKLSQAGLSGNVFHISSDFDGSGWCIPFLTVSNGHFVATGWDQNGEVTATDPALAAAGQWYQLISTWDATNGLRLFVDGDLVATTPQSEYAASGASMYASLGLGNSQCSNNQGFLDGEVDDARIYSRALIASDVEAIAAEGLPVTPAADSSPVNATPAGTITAPNTGLATDDMFVIKSAMLVALAITMLALASRLRHRAALK